MKAIAAALSGAVLAMTAGCVGASSDAPPMAEIGLNETLERFKTTTGFVDGVVTAEARRRDGSARTLTSARHLEAEWGLYAPPPPIPGFVSREFLLSENRHDGRTLLYALVEWNDGNPDEYMAFGWWMHLPVGASFRELEAAELGVFMDGPELDLSTPPEMPVSGEATYLGGIGGLYEYRYGSGWREELRGESQYVEFSAPIALTADFSDASIGGCIGCTGDVVAETLHLYPIVAWRGPPPDALPADYEIRLGRTPFGANGIFEDSGIAVSHPERTVTETEGVWGGQFSNVPDPVGNPRRVVGLVDIRFAEADGSSGSFLGGFSALTPATVRPPESETP
ncbi:MAG: hypothetical protein OYH76_17485 [Defluviicoccus sp.]|nr:hypothetical protein [Defluviicoccus sp.]MDE0277690.1 hypothetical protein [Defluviicoccus sp.]